MDLELTDLLIKLGDFQLNANITFKKATKYAVLGASGSGKSTLLSCIAGFIKPMSGQMKFDDHSILDLPPNLRPATLLFQHNNLFTHLSVFQNVALGIKTDLKLTDAEKQKVMDALDQVELGGMSARMPDQLSGGQQQRVAIARALLRDKPVLMLDEPFASLGPALKYDIIELVDQIISNANMTLLMVTHQIEDTLSICDELVMIADGQVEAPQPITEILDKPSKSLEYYLGDHPLIKKPG